jgi:hypothetical protein
MGRCIVEFRRWLMFVRASSIPFHCMCVSKYMFNMHDYMRVCAAVIRDAQLAAACRYGTQKLPDGWPTLICASLFRAYW